MYNPVSTYRIQFNKDFTFKDFIKIVPYLNELGIKTIYASPIYQAVAGSNHGYDVTDPNQINPEIGTLEELREISALLKSHEMHWVQDIVPNHMAFHPDNAWLMDVLVKGNSSPYRKYFDILSDDLEKEPIMLPFLGQDLANVIANNELTFVKQDGKGYLKYFDTQWPVKKMPAKKGDVGLTELAAAQYYRLCNYKETNTKINYRRFFTVNSLICLNIQVPSVFEDHHRFTKQLIDEGIFQGLRIDHIDGLADPTNYLKMLRKLCGNETYIVVEKILHAGEPLPNYWPIQGTTGYDYLGLANQLFTNEKSRKIIHQFYEKISGQQPPILEQILAKKRRFLNEFMLGELAYLYNLMLDLRADNPSIKSATKKASAAQVYKKMIGEFMVRMPVYRLYINSYPLKKVDIDTLDEIFLALSKYAEFKPLVTDFRNWLIGDGKSENGNALIFIKRLMQYSGPLMAKGVEDTLMYTFNRFIGNNEVGDSPEFFGVKINDFHAEIAKRTENWPIAMNATATHDTKRGEDARARLAVLTYLPNEWIAQVAVWRELNKDIKSGNSPDDNDEYFIYQTLVATCPEEGPFSDDYEQRLLAYVEKALRESKRNTNWDDPVLDYETQTKDFIQYLLDPSREFWLKFNVFLQKVAAIGKLVSLSSLVLKHTLPGIPDTYQGTELWDLSMVDPDNRRAVDYQLRMKLLSKKTKSTEESTPTIDQLDAATKLKLTSKLLQHRKQHSKLYAEGTYLPLKVTGKYATDIIAFARQYQGQWLIVASAVNLGNVLSAAPSYPTLDWKDTKIVLPTQLCTATLSFTDIISGKEVEAKSVDPNAGILEVKQLFNSLPIAVLEIAVPEKKRGAGILMHISSLPSNYGIGDFGPTANNFLSSLAECGLKYWQLLPMNPLSPSQSFSPYSSSSSMAGNTLFISTEQLIKDGLIAESDLKKYRLPNTRKVNFDQVVQLKSQLLEEAYQTWKSTDTAISNEDFLEFCKDEEHWLEDYVLFELISSQQKDEPWYLWPTPLKNRKATALAKLRKAHAEALEELKWQQFIFFRQWKSIRRQAKTLGIKIVGDLPFYAAHNSADVWVNPALFAVDTNGKVTGVAGVPPDYFNADGQLWGMPVYNWEAMKSEGFKWWKDRISANLKLYDLVRLDHFRAFSAYWEVPSDSETAKNGAWKTGPGTAFFEAISASLGELPFIAEDLGEIDHSVYQLRDQFVLPGMKVLQFGFGDDMQTSIHMPHNFNDNNCIVYTGTHDNNTTRGWYQDDSDKPTKARIANYLGNPINKKTIAPQLIRLAMMSTANVTIIPMQDLLNKPSAARMNVPASVDNNWTWRLRKNVIDDKFKTKMLQMIKLYNR